MKVFIFLFIATLWQVGSFEPITSEFGGEVNIAEAHHKPWHTSGGGNCKKNPKNCQPPTVSELPIQYMVMSGAALILLAGSTVFFIRKRRMQNTPEA